MRVQVTADTNPEMTARSKMVDQILIWIRTVSEEYRFVERDFQRQLLHVAGGDRIAADDVSMPADIMQTIAVHIAYQLGYQAGIQQWQHQSSVIHRRLQNTNTSNSTHSSHGIHC